MRDSRTITQTVRGHRLTAELSEAALECRLTVVSDLPYDELTPNGIGITLLKMGISYGIIPDALGKICRDIKNRAPVMDVLVARGREAVHGKDAELEVISAGLTRPHDEKHRSNDGKSDAEGSGPVDDSDLPRYPCVEEGSLFARLEPATSGKDGKSVTGETIPAESGRRITVRLGRGVCRSPDRKGYVATTGGRVIWENRTLSVAQVLTIKGDVDLDVGHVDFSGYVHVSGDVLEGFSVMGRRGITIEGNAQGCRLESDGSIKVGGLIGHQLDTAVRCGGNFEARYVLESDIECEGNAHVMRETMRSKLKAGGIITVDGLISDSECIAMTGIEARRVGTDAGTHAKLVSGIYYRDHERTAFLRGKLRKTIEEINKRAKEVKPLLRKKNTGPSARDIERMKKAFEKLQELNSRRTDLECQLEEFTGSSSARQPNPKINVKQFLAQGTLVCLGSTSEHIQETVERPVSIIEHRGRELVLLKMTDLRLSAAKLEHRLVARECAETR